MEQLTGGDSLLQLVTFTMGIEEYAVDILKVQEINRMTEIAKVPNAPEYVEGVINLRGRVIPVVSLRKRFGFDEKESDEQSHVLTVNYFHRPQVALAGEGRQAERLRRPDRAPGIIVPMR